MGGAAEDYTKFMSFWLVKSEPEVWSWAQQVAKGVEPWTGVRNHLAARHLKAMRVGERAFFYHSNTGREIVGIVDIVREAYPDPTDESGRFVAVDVRAAEPLARPVTLSALKSDPFFADFVLIRQSRLSVMPVTPAQWERICAMGKGL